MGHKKIWNEFDWEKELRKDEQRIHSYLCELDRCLDLPGEEEFIMKKLLSEPKLVPARPDNETGEFDSFYEDNYELMMNNEWRKNRKGTLAQIEALAKEWTLTFTAECHDDNFIIGMRILCMFGKLLTRHIDLFEIDNCNDPLPLKQAVLKRIYAEINQLLGEFAAFDHPTGRLKQKISKNRHRLQHIREQIFDQINELRK